MELLSPFPLSYITWILVFVAIPLVILWILNFDYFKKYLKIFILTSGGALLFSVPWDFIAIKEQIWMFEKPYIFGIWFLGLPIEEWLFIVLVTALFTSVTLLFWKKWGNDNWYV